MVIADNLMLEDSEQQYTNLNEVSETSQKKKQHKRWSHKKSASQLLRNNWDDISPWKLLRKLWKPYKSKSKGLLGVLDVLAIFLVDTIPTLIAYGILLPINVLCFIPDLALNFIVVSTTDVYYRLRGHEIVIIN